MKKRQPLTEILDDVPAYCLFGAETILNRVGELEKQIAGAKNSDDIEYVHRLRVASRRVRTALNIFTECLPPKQVRKWKKTIRKVTVSCGAARDTDVLIAFLGDYSTHLDARA